MNCKELGKKVLEQAKSPLSVKEIWERACEMGLDKELKKGKRKAHSSEEDEKQSIASLGSALGEHKIPKDKKQFFVTNNKNPFFIGSNLVKENFLHKKPQTPKKKMMDRAGV
ncbi:hypothetical protein ID0189_01320 [Helicobacter pylori]